MMFFFFSQAMILQPIPYTSFSFENRTMKIAAIPVRRRNPSTMKNLDRREKPRNTDGSMIRLRIPIVTEAKECMIRWIMRIAVMMPIGTPSRDMNQAQTGWPPVAEGVIAEQ